MGKLTAPRIEPSEIQRVTATATEKQHERDQENAPVEQEQHDRADQHALSPAEAKVHRKHMPQYHENTGHQLADRSNQKRADRDCCRALCNVPQQHEQRFARPHCAVGVGQSRRCRCHSCGYPLPSVTLLTMIAKPSEPSR